ncbi:MAG: hypothetical protein A3B68_00980 [Candidatus Melainabacteria bacterium RIFCSPHIGHO2_02_FULL_34_12]|nr:MAG: hypothetical protein A3B68_00980 [Candidatus Melainabacteria bacterium RIFCSPHIGHO2_02_FULL_34_12]
MQTTTELNIDIEEYLKKQKKLIDSKLNFLLDKAKKNIDLKELYDAISYSLLNGGKRIRGALCLATFETYAKNADKELFEDCLTTACSIEIIHAMSLIHDDLPSMDNDDIRRGKPSCHKVFGEANAILTGDGMLTLAFQLIIENTNKINDKEKLEVINILAKAFTFGLVPGQMLDLETVNKSADLNTIDRIAKLKTAELIKAAVICGALIAKKNSTIPIPDSILKSLDIFGINIGKAFQVIDDILDVISDTKTLGKTSGKDRKRNKPTYPSVIGLEAAKKTAEDLIENAKFELHKANTDTCVLSSIADFIIKRIY